MKYRSSGKLIRNRMGRALTMEDKVVTHFHALGVPGICVIGIVGENAKGNILVDTDTCILDEGVKRLRKGQKVFFAKQKDNPNSHLVVGIDND